MKRWIINSQQSSNEKSRETDEKEKKNRKWTAHVDKSLRNNKYVVHIKRERRTAWKSLQTGSLLIPPLSFQCTDKLQIPRTHSMFYLFVFSTSHLYIYTLCVHLSFPTQLEHAFLFLFFFFCFNMFPLQLRPNDRSWCIFFCSGQESRSRRRPQ